jgi:tetratricopeptide (TPR) repeat protein
VKRVLRSSVAVLAGAAMVAAGALLVPRALRSNPAPAYNVPIAATEGIVVGGSLDSTIASLQERLRTTDDPRSLASLGIAYLQKARSSADPTYYAKAEGALRRSLSTQAEDNFDAAIGMGLLSLGRHDFDDALRWGQRAEEINSFSAPALGVVGDALVELGRYDAATSTYREMVELRPSLSSYARVSYTRELRGDVRGAIAAMQTAQAAALPGSDDAAWASHQIGDLYLLIGDLGRAARAYRAALWAVPAYGPARVGMARIAAASGDLDAASRLLARVTTSYPLPAYVALYGDVLDAAGREADAQRQYELVEAQTRLYESNGVLPDVETYVYLSDHDLLQLQDVSELRGLYARRPSIRVADALGWALYSVGEAEEARSYARAALRLGTRDPLYHFHAGMIAHEVGDRTAARRHLSRALGLNESFSILHASTARKVLHSLREGSRR